MKQKRHGSCIFCNRLEDFVRLFAECRVNIFIIKNIYITESACCCFQYLDTNGFIPHILLVGLQFVKRPYNLFGTEVHNFLQSLRQAAIINESNFNNEESFSEDEFRAISPITRDHFRELYSYCDPVPEPRSKVRYVGIKNFLTFLCKICQNLSDDCFEVIFRFSRRQAVNLSIATVRRSLMLRFVPYNIGLNAITREQYI